jgi:hypothetical protein
MATPVFGSVGTYGQTTSGNPAASVDVGVPASVASGDIILLHLFTDLTGSTITPPSGFAEVASSPQPVPGGLSMRLSVYWKRATGADSGTYTTAFSPNTFAEGAETRWTGCVTSGSPFDATNGAVDSVGSTSTAAVSVTTTQANTLLVHTAGLWSGGTWTPASGFTGRVTSGGFNLLYTGDKGQAAAGSSGTVQATCSAASNNVNAAHLLALIGSTPPLPPRPIRVYGQAINRASNY